MNPILLDSKKRPSQQRSKVRKHFKVIKRKKKQKHIIPTKLQKIYEKTLKFHEKPQNTTTTAIAIAQKPISR